jgi:6-pyruvoyltetrahydropterin/6-carboxytetrahydropterin synthase
MQVVLTKKFRFEAAQTVPHIARCNKMHGHSFKIEISVKGVKNETTGYFCDHALISQAMHPLLHLVDHAYLNEIEGLENPTIEIELKDSATELYFRVANKKGTTMNETKDESSGIGLANVKRRLELLYPTNHQLEVKDSGSDFTITLTIQHT